MDTGDANCCESTAPEDEPRVRAWWDLQRERFPGFDLVPHVMRLLAAEGRPVTLERVAAAASWPEPEVRAALASHPGVDWDGDGRLAGFGLTLRPTPHRFTFEGRTVFGFCASDALEFPVVLGTPGVVESTCPSTGRTVRIELTPDAVTRVDPGGAVVSLVRPDSYVDIRAQCCDMGCFYASGEAAAGWLAGHPEGMLHSVEDEFQQCREQMVRAGWAPSVRAPR